jgi:hypothetical protein
MFYLIITIAILLAIAEQGISLECGQGVKPGFAFNMRYAKDVPPLNKLRTRTINVNGWCVDVKD